jgi:hypothetical protein
VRHVLCDAPAGVEDGAEAEAEAEAGADGPDEFAATDASGGKRRGKGKKKGGGLSDDEATAAAALKAQLRAKRLATEEEELDLADGNRPKKMASSSMADRMRERDLLQTGKSTGKTRAQVEPLDFEPPPEAKAATDFLAKHCILPPEKREHYQKLFTKVDDNESGTLDQLELTRALKTLNKNLISDNEIDYTVRVLELMGGAGIAAHNSETGLFEITFEQFAVRHVTSRHGVRRHVTVCGVTPRCAARRAALLFSLHSTAIHAMRLGVFTWFARARSCPTAACAMRRVLLGGIVAKQRAAGFGRDSNPFHNRESGGPLVRRCVRGCVRACVRGCVRACVRGCVRARVRGCVRASVRLCVRASVRAFPPHSNMTLQAIAALSEKVVALDKATKHTINDMDFDALESKMLKASGRPCPPPPSTSVLHPSNQRYTLSLLLPRSHAHDPIRSLLLSLFLCSLPNEYAS